MDELTKEMNLKRTRDLGLQLRRSPHSVGRKIKANESDREVTEEVGDQGREVAPKLQKGSVNKMRVVKCREWIKEQKQQRDTSISLQIKGRVTELSVKDVSHFGC